MPSVDVAETPRFTGRPSATPTDSTSVVGEARVDGRRNDTRERILTAALELFARNGYRQTSIAAIEGAVGLRPGSGGLYRHFPSKEALFVEAVTDYTARVRRLRRQLAVEAHHAPAKSIESDLRHLLASLAAFLSNEQPIVQATADAASLPDAARRVLGAAWDEGYSMATDVFERHGTEAGRARSLGIAAIGSINHYASHLGYWSAEPLGVALGDFVDDWVALWAGAARA